MGPLDFPPYIAAILRALKDRGYSAYIVGGAVRDWLRGAVPVDYDIATAARPEEVINLAKEKGWQVVDKLGHNFGVVLVVVGRHKAEVATFRGERYGSDSHRPAQVWYADTIEADLARRDFTINAMALTLDHRVIDPYGGQADLTARLIRLVGDGHVRFAEDGLRLFRACRFVAQLDFAVEEQTLGAMTAQISRVEGLSLARVREELNKLITAPAAYRGLALLIKTGLAGASCQTRQGGEYRSVAILPELMSVSSEASYDRPLHIMETLRHAPPVAAVRWAALFQDAQLAAGALTRLGMAAQLIKRVEWLVTHHRIFHLYRHDQEKGLDWWVREQARCGQFRYNRELVQGVEDLIGLVGAQLAAANVDSQTLSEAEAFALALRGAARTMPVHTSDVAYKGPELTALLGQASLVGPFLKNVLRRIQDRELANDRDAVAEAARRWVSGREDNYPSVPNE